MQSVFKFIPFYKERPWGGRAIAGVGSHRSLPAAPKIGEAWEICDRQDDESLIAEGEFKGQSIRWLMDTHGTTVMGKAWPQHKRFPLLIKILDAAERLSLQVHPPEAVSKQLDGEPKTELWFLLSSTPEAALMAGLKKGVTQVEFENVLRGGGSNGSNLETLIHRISVKKGDSMFIPSGRIHAIDAGCLILEIQQNSDTTYRVYDWGRLGLDGKPRQMHIEQTLKCTDFNDFEPPLLLHDVSLETQVLGDCDYFRIESWVIDEVKTLESRHATIIHATKGDIEITSNLQDTTLVRWGETALLASCPHRIRPMAKKAEMVITWCI